MKIPKRFLLAISFVIVIGGGLLWISFKGLDSASQRREAILNPPGGKRPTSNVVLRIRSFDVESRRFSCTTRVGSKVRVGGSAPVFLFVMRCPLRDEHFMDYHVHLDPIKDVLERSQSHPVETWPFDKETLVADFQTSFDAETVMLGDPIDFPRDSYRAVFHIQIPRQLDHPLDHEEIKGAVAEPIRVQILEDMPDLHLREARLLPSEREGVVLVYLEIARPGTYAFWAAIIIASTLLLIGPILYFRDPTDVAHYTAGIFFAAFGVRTLLVPRALPFLLKIDIVFLLFLALVICISAVQFFIVRRNRGDGAPVS